MTDGNHIFAKTDESGNVTHLITFRRADNISGIDIFVMKYKGYVRKEIGMDTSYLHYGISVICQSITARSVYNHMKRIKKKLSRIGVTKLKDLTIFDITNNKLEPVTDLSIKSRYSKFLLKGSPLNGIISSNIANKICNKDVESKYLGWITINNSPLKHYDLETFYVLMKSTHNEDLISTLDKTDFYMFHDSIAATTKNFNRFMNSLKIRGISSLKKVSNTNMCFAFFIKDDEALLHLKLALPCGSVNVFKIDDIKELMRV